MLDLYEELIRVIHRLDQAGIKYLLCGGLAYSLYAEARATEDIDMLILPQTWPACIDALKKIGYLDLTGPLDFKNIQIRRLVKIEGEDSLVLDFLLAQGELEAAFETAVTYQLENVIVQLVDIPTLIHLKLGRMSDKDQLDIINLKKVMRGEFKGSH